MLSGKSQQSDVKSYDLDLNYLLIKRVYFPSTALLLFLLVSQLSANQNVDRKGVYLMQQSQ